MSYLIMGFYYLDEPPEKESRWKKFIPGWLRSWWAETSEVLLIIRMVFGVILPVIGVLFGFIFLFAFLVFLLNLCSSASR